MRYEFDEQAAAGYVYISDRTPPKMRTIMVGDGVAVDVAEHNSVIGIEILGPPTVDRFVASIWTALVMVARRCEFSDRLDEMWDDIDMANEASDMDNDGLDDE